jgi:hypothetical protein
MNDFLYILKCSNRSYFAWYIIMLITSRDCNHITWSLNSAFVSLLATFSSSQLSQKRSKISDCTFWNFFYKTKFSFILISCTRNRHLIVIENYIERDDVIWCEFDRLAFIEIELDRVNLIVLLSLTSISDCTFWNLSYKQRNFFLIHSVYAKTTFNVDRRLYKRRYCDLMRTWLFSFHRSLSRKKNKLKMS